MNTTQAPAKPIVFFDGSCPLCKKEIAHYQRIDKQQLLDWVDLTQATDRLASYGIDYQTAMKRLHCIDDSGNRQIGIKAFMLIWQHLDYYRHLATIIRVLHLARPLDFVYRHFADWRFKRRCDQGCSIN